MSGTGRLKLTMFCSARLEMTSKKLLWTSADRTEEQGGNGYAEGEDSA